MKKNDLVTRNYVATFETRSDEEVRGLVTGRPIVFNSRTNIAGLFDEIIERGALDGADLTDVSFMTNHDLNQLPLARYRSDSDNNSLSFELDENGMTFKTILDIDNNARAAELYSAICRGDITGMSFMFGVADDDWEGLDSDMPTRHITKISKVVEVSAVNNPAYKSTSINSRSLDAESILTEARKVLVQEKDNKDELELLRTRNRNNFLF